MKLSLNGICLFLVMYMVQCYFVLWLLFTTWERVYHFLIVHFVSTIGIYTDTCVLNMVYFHWVYSYLPLHDFILFCLHLYRNDRNSNCFQWMWVCVSFFSFLSLIMMFIFTTPLIYVFHAAFNYCHLRNFFIVQQRPQHTNNDPIFLLFIEPEKDRNLIVKMYKCQFMKSLPIENVPYIC